MNKALIGIVAAVVLGAAVYIGYTSLQDESSDQATETTQEQQDGTTENGDGLISGTLKDLVARGQSMQCTFSQETEEGPVSGTVYVSGEKARIDSTAPGLEGEQMNTHIIRDKDVMYMWSDGESDGLKMAIPDPEEQPDVETPDIPDSQSNVPDLEDNPADYSCDPWTADSSMFNPPASVNFVDFGEQFQQIQDSVQQDIEQNTDVNLQDQCSICENIPAGESRDACLQQFGC